MIAAQTRGASVVKSTRRCASYGLWPGGLTWTYPIERGHPDRQAPLAGAMHSACARPTALDQRLPPPFLLGRDGVGAGVAAEARKAREPAPKVSGTWRALPAALQGAGCGTGKARVRLVLRVGGDGAVGEAESSQMSSSCRCTATMLCRSAPRSRSERWWWVVVRRRRRAKASSASTSPTAISPSASGWLKLSAPSSAGAATPVRSALGCGH
mmetsp:Transcript_7149/g.15644  ORF Transcript_7149/g.15644 Transcript_7149/m.15644 type:complete len:212 (-) Transcript_7149:257-892(-)